MMWLDHDAQSVGERDLEIHQSKKGQKRFFGMKAYIGADADSGLDCRSIDGPPIDFECHSPPIQYVYQRH